LTYSLEQAQIDAIEAVLRQDLIDLGVRCVFLIDMAGNIIADLDDGATDHDIYSLAALAAGNFGAVSSMAKIIGKMNSPSCSTRARGRTFISPK